MNFNHTEDDDRTKITARNKLEATAGVAIVNIKVSCLH